MITVPEIADKITKLYSILKQIDSTENTARKINDILIHGDKVPLQLLTPAWELFAKKMGAIQ